MGETRLATEGHDQAKEAKSYRPDYTGENTFQRQPERERLADGWARRFGFACHEDRLAWSSLVDSIEEHQDDYAWFRTQDSRVDGQRVGVRAGRQREEDSLWILEK